MQDSGKQRITYLDTAKGIGIFLVVLGHAITNREEAADLSLLVVLRFITFFHMALFFFINGMLYSEKYSKNPLTGSLKKVKAYYLPFVIFNLIFWAFHNLFAKLHLISGALDEKDYAYVGVKAFAVSFVKSVFGYRQKFAGAMWFLEVLLIISVVFIFLDFFFRKLQGSKKYIALGIAVGVLLVANRVLNITNAEFLPLSITRLVFWAFDGLVFFYTGYLYKQINGNGKLEKFKYAIAGGCFAVVCAAALLTGGSVVSVVTNNSTAVYINPAECFFIRGEETLPLALYILYAVVCQAGILMTILFAQFRFVRDSRGLKMLGRYSLPIMCLQFLAFKPVSLLMIGVYKLPIEDLAGYPVIQGIDGGWWILYTVCGLALPVLAMKGYEWVKGLIIRAFKKK